MSLTNFELEVMQLFWELEKASAPQVHKLIEQKRSVKYSTVKTIIDRLENKKSIKRSGNQGRTIFYVPINEKKTIKIPLIRNFIDKVFLGNSRPLAAHILEQEILDLEDIEYLENILKKRKKDLK
ncbi:BlaI/MecI/CopY family transcriptional regulator [Psychrobium sp. nBUS_13]|uniref:BlaI/MecI/CopY family transcriptional regulator n=1 Tax=Psychrobium sp. nBUS_13 TaxID=3395319 RepID=UPI003EB97511